MTQVSDDRKATEKTPLVSDSHRTPAYGGDIEKLSQDSELETNGEVDSFYGWMVVAGAFFILFVIIGMMYSFGVFLLPIGQDLGVGRGDVSWVGAIAASLQPGLAPLAGRVSERIGFRITVMIGATMVGLGFFLSTFATHIYVLYFTFGVLVGTGSSFAFLPCIACLAQWFEKRRGLAVGIAVTGSGLGNMLLPPLLEYLIDSYGWRTAFYVIGAGGFLINVVSACTFRQRFRTATVFNFAPLFRNRSFQLLYVSCLLTSLGYLVPFVHAYPFAKDIGMSDTDAALALGMMGLASALGRFVLGIVGDYIGSLHVLKFSVATLGVAVLVWSMTDSELAVYIFCFVYGFFAGAFIAQMPVVLAEIFGVLRMSSVSGLIYSAAGLGNLVGPAAAGWLFDLYGNYHLAQWIASATILAGSSLYWFLPKERGKILE